MKELKAFKDNNQLPNPEFRMEDGYFVITVYRKKLKDREIEVATKKQKVLEGLKDDELKGYEYLETQKRVTKKQYAEYFSLGEKTAQRHLALFKGLKLVKQVGKGPATEYHVI